jgi:hypothetical protein
MTTMAKTSPNQLKAVREVLKDVIRRGYGTGTIYDGRTGNALSERGVASQSYSFGSYSYPLRAVSRLDSRLHAETYQWCVDNGLGELADKYQVIQVKRAIGSAMPKYQSRLHEIDAAIAKLEAERTTLLGKITELNESLAAIEATEVTKVAEAVGEVTTEESN